jgi:hypothetical protein
MVFAVLGGEGGFEGQDEWQYIVVVVSSCLCTVGRTCSGVLLISPRQLSV